MDKRYQVFVSSTFTDLEDERKHVIQTLMEMDCIPAGMELFPAIDEEQWEFIKRIIDDCDYYLLIIGGRYGSVADDGLSYTEKEFDYAVSKGLKVIVLVHENPGQLPVNKSELNPDSREKLANFIVKTSEGRLRKTWASVKDLPGLVALSMTKTIKTYPATGWVRANRISNEASLQEIHELRNANKELKDRLEKITESNLKEDELELADMKDTYKFECYSYNSTRREDEEWYAEMSWEDIFIFISPHLIKCPTEADVSRILGAEAQRRTFSPGTGARVSENDLNIIGMQFEAYELILIKFLPDDSGVTSLLWMLTEKGKREMLKLKTVKKVRN
ncbi:DUF4062 domain-containing protein [Serratia nevei]|uniref:DUF4062 domain-containing protein n=1 Tax=Serratia nevei TaxID=2703794 RepID=UPI003FA6A9B6